MHQQIYIYIYIYTLQNNYLQPSGLAQLYRVFRNRVATGSNAGRDRRYWSLRILYSTSIRIAVCDKDNTFRISPDQITTSKHSRQRHTINQTSSYTGTICFPRGSLLQLFVYLLSIHSVSLMVGWFVSCANLYRQSPCTLPPQYRWRVQAKSPYCATTVSLTCTGKNPCTVPPQYRWRVQAKSLYGATTVSLTCKGKVPVLCHHNIADVYRQRPCTVPPQYRWYVQAKSLYYATTVSLTCTGKVPVRCNHNIRRNRRLRDAFTIRRNNKFQCHSLCQ